MIVLRTSIYLSVMRSKTAKMAILYQRVYPTQYAQVKFCPKYPSKTLEIYIAKNNPIETPPPEDDNGDENINIPPNEIDTTPIDPPMCDTHSNTITWQEKESHTVYDSEGYSHTCTHTYSYSATLKVDSINITPDTLKSGYGVDVDVSTSVSYKQTGQKRSSSYCSRRLSSSRTPTNKPAPPTKVTARLGWTTHTFDCLFIQGSSVPLERVSSSSTKAAFSAPYNDVVGEKGIYTVLMIFEGTYNKIRKTSTPSIKAVTLKPKFLSKWYPSNASQSLITEEVEASVELWQKFKKAYQGLTTADLAVKVEGIIEDEVNGI